MFIWTPNPVSLMPAYKMTEFSVNTQGSHIVHHKNYGILSMRPQLQDQQLTWFDSGGLS